MKFSVYMLLCADNSIYTGHTEDLDVRLRCHRARTFCGYTARRLPVKLIFAHNFPTRDEAFAAERKIKGWTRAKKLALADGDWDSLRELSVRRTPDRLRNT
jgi:predicted GIY-YIG superfamily endonuclease